MLEGGVTWFKTSLLTMVYAIVLFTSFIATVKFSRDLGSPIAVLLLAFLSTLIAAGLRPRSELKLWLMLTGVGVAGLVAIFALMLVIDV